MGRRREVKYFPWTNRQESNFPRQWHLLSLSCALFCDSYNATVSGAAEASCPAVWCHVEKYATRTLNLSQPITNVTASRTTDASCPAVWSHVEKCTTRTLNLNQLNINGTLMKIHELSGLLHENNIHAKANFFGFLPLALFCSR